MPRSCSAGELEDALGGRRFAGVHVGEDANVSVSTKVFHSFARAIGRFATRPLPRKQGCASPRLARGQIRYESSQKWRSQG
jgi:hypothetical protein